MADPGRGSTIPESNAEVRARYVEAVAFAAAQKHTKAVDAYRTCLKTDPETALARLGLCESLLALGERDAAVAEAAPMETLVPQNEQVWRQAFTLFRRLGDRTRAERVTRHFISAVGGSAEARLELVEMQPVPDPRSRDRIEGDLADALLHAVDEPWFWQRVAKQQRRLGRLREALDAIEHALRIQPDDFAARCERIDILVRRDEERLARRHLAETMPFVPDTVQGWLQIAEIATEAHDPAVVRCAINRAIGTMKPEWHVPRFRLARVMLANSDARAIDAIRDLTNDCDTPETLRELFAVCYEKNLIELALAAGEKAQRIAPNYDIATRMASVQFVASRQKSAPGHGGKLAFALRYNRVAGLFRRRAHR